MAYTSSQAHSSIEKAAMIAGVGSKNIRHVDVNNDFSMNISSLKKKIIKDIGEGYIPFLFVLQLVQHLAMQLTR